MFDVVYTADSTCQAEAPYSSPEFDGTNPVISFVHLDPNNDTLRSGTGSTGSGELFPLGTSTVVVYATNDCGMDSVVFTVTVNDETAPVVAIDLATNINPTDTIISINKAGCLSGFTFDSDWVTVSDNCTDEGNITWSWCITTQGTTHSDVDTADGMFTTYDFEPGAYTVTLYARDASGNVGKADFNITVEASELMIDHFSVTTHVSCFGDADGSVKITYNNGIGTNTIKVVDVSDTSNLVTILTRTSNSVNPTVNLNDLPAGEYIIEVIDGFGCKVQTMPFEISQPAEIVLTAVATEPTICGGNNGELAITVNGGVDNGAFTIEVFAGNSNTATDVATNISTGSTYTTYGLSSGTYKVKVSQGGDCFVEETFTIEECTGVDLSPFIVMGNPTLSNTQKSTTMNIFIDNLGSIVSSSNEEIKITVLKGSSLINLTVSDPNWTVQNNGSMATITGNVSIGANSFVEIPAVLEVLAGMPTPGIVVITYIVNSSEDSNSNNNSTTSSVVIYSH